ncbi:hypothetical protein [Fontivita pretiosa]|uniref:hypothetical protein n=1 Tax=Fontivita pretiosa TaxID=2989684 RepID=UPI003D17B985
MQDGQGSESPGDDQPAATTTFELTPADDELFEDEQSVYAILKAGRRRNRSHVR